MNKLLTANETAMIAFDNKGKCIIEKWHQSKPYQYLIVMEDGKLINKGRVKKTVFAWFNTEPIEPPKGVIPSINVSYFKIIG
jgi:hypothetical protein